ncbi:conserved hypothetical protein [Bacteroides fragilis NCTC 9343]|nr:conserved hypothetical protein [Bacteroides fragilis NCTC 9343]
MPGGCVLYFPAVGIHCILFFNLKSYCVMFSLLLSTFAMMGLTFVIGFFVAGVIKLIASAADSLAFYSSHQEELARLKRIRKLHQKVATLITESALSDEEYGSDGREDFSRGVTKHPGDNRGFYHGVSPGESERGLMDYFYPEDTRTMFLRKEEQMLQHDKKNNKTSSTNKKQ